MVIAMAMVIGVFAVDHNGDDDGVLAGGSDSDGDC